MDQIVKLLEAIYQSMLEKPEKQQGNCKNCQLKNQSTSRILDNADIKQMLKIGDTKLYYLKKKKILKPYKLDGKDVYLEHEVLEAIKRSGEL